ncbi:MAG: sensor histidine kinase [Propioniciclava sp.]|uniref:sensor histidine kinase n=1 Tax=Propioniciclava sp. TaxID=2038686 RepID=UPI0039E6CD4B
MFTRSRSVASHVLIVLGGILVFVVGLSTLTAYTQAVRHVEDAAAARVLDIARAVAATDDVREALASDDPAAELTEVVERARQLTATDFIVVMSPGGVRYTHPTAGLVGGQYAGTIAGAAAGGEVVEQFTGSLGPSTRAVVPVLVDGEVTGLVAVGLRRDRVSQHLAATLPQVLLPGLAAAVLAGAGAWWVANRVRQQTLGLNAVELRRLHDHHDAVLHAVREGLVITDTSGNLQVVNDEARRLLGLAPDAVGRPVSELGIAPGLAALLAARGQHVDVPHVSGGRVLLVSCDVVRRKGAVVATLTTLRDRTELAELTGQLATTQSLADALHAQAHEAANKLHTVITLIEVGRSDAAVAFATQDLDASRRQRDAILAAVEEPAVAALLLGKVSQAAERGVALDLDPDAHLPAGVVQPHPVVTILGNLIDNALDALATGSGGAAPEIVVDAQVSAGEVVLTVSDNGPGLEQDQRERAFERGFTTKDASGPAGRGIGLALVRQNAELLGGRVTVSDPPGATFTVTLPVAAHG